MTLRLDGREVLDADEPVQGARSEISLRTDRLDCDGKT